MTCQVDFSRQKAQRLSRLSPASKSMFAHICHTLCDLSCLSWFDHSAISLNNTQKGDTGALLMATTRTRWCYIRLSPRAACRPHRALALSSPPTSWRATSARQRSCPFRPRRIGTTARAGARSPVRGGWEWRMGGWWCGERVVLGLPRALALGFFVRILPDQGNVVVSS